MAIDLIQANLPLLLALLAFPLVTLVAPLYAACVLVDRLEGGNRAARRKAHMKDTLALHALYEGTVGMADRIEVLEGGLRPAGKGERL
jgi:hypothetical protein